MNERTTSLVAKFRAQRAEKAMNEAAPVVADDQQMIEFKSPEDFMAEVRRVVDEAQKDA